MIYKMQFTDGFPTNLPNIGKRIFEFTDGVNLIYGPNGCGKSTILKTLKAYCGIEKAGWTKVSQPTVLGTMYIGRMSEAIGFPHAYRKYTPSGCMANVLWDGMPVFFNDGDIKVSDTFFFQNAGQSEDGITTEQEQMEMLAKHLSSGQFRIDKINKIFQMLTNSPLPITAMETLPPRIQYPEIAEKEVQYWRSLTRRSKKYTILFDEPERSLSLPLQKELLLNSIPKYLKDYQVIIATHSIFALDMKNVNVIDIENGYANLCLDLIKQIGR